MKRRRRRKHIVEESVDNIIVSQEITYPPAALLFMHYSTIHTTYSFLGRRQKGRVRPIAALFLLAYRVRLAKHAGITERAKRLMSYI